MTKDISLVDGYGNLIKSESDILHTGDLDEVFDESVKEIFCVDTSWSMEEPINKGERTYKIELLKKAVEHYINNKMDKNTEKHMGLVKFDSEAAVCCGLSNDKQVLLNRVESLFARGSTNMADGLTLALQILGGLERQWTPRIILISDGQPQQRDRVWQVLDPKKGTNLIVDVIYIGAYADDFYRKFMKQIAAQHNGVYEEITNEAEFETKFLKVAERPLLSAGNPLLEE